MSLRLRFFRLPKHNQYDYKPRYWDQQKEELEERLKRIEDRQDGDIEAVKARIAGGFRRGFKDGHNRFRRKQVARSNYILIITIAMLAILALFVLPRILPGLLDFIGN